MSTLSLFERSLCTFFVQLRLLWTTVTFVTLTRTFPSVYVYIFPQRTLAYQVRMHSDMSILWSGVFTVVLLAFASLLIIGCYFLFLRRHFLDKFGISEIYKFCHYLLFLITLCRWIVSLGPARLKQRERERDRKRKREREQDREREREAERIPM